MQSGAGLQAEFLCPAPSMCHTLYSIMVIQDTILLCCAWSVLHYRGQVPQPLLMLKRLCCQTGCSPICCCGWRLPQADPEAQHPHLPGDSKMLPSARFTHMLCYGCPPNSGAGPSRSSAYALLVQFLYYMSSFWALYGSHTTSFLLSAEVRVWAEHHCLPGLCVAFPVELASNTALKCSMLNGKSSVLGLFVLQMYPAQVRGTAHGISAATGKVGSIGIVVSAPASKACDLPLS